jgi:hypothetical protein
MSGQERNGMQNNTIKDWKKSENENRGIPNFLKTDGPVTGPPKNALLKK